jgi:hypothetical protein
MHHVVPAWLRQPRKAATSAFETAAGVVDATAFNFADGQNA